MNTIRPRLLDTIGRLSRRPLLLCALIISLSFALGARGATSPSPLPPTPPRPEAEAGPTKVGYVIWIGDITQIDSAAQTFSANLVIFLRWRDPQLAHAGPGTKQFALDSVWNPRLVIANEAGEVERSLPEVVDVAPDGTVIYRQRLIGSFAQSLNLRAFPFDHDTFRVQIVTLGYRPEEIELAPDARALAAGMPEGVGLAEKLTIQDWRIKSVGSHVHPYPLAPRLELAAFSFEFTAARNANHFVIKVIIPLILIVMMSWAVFWIEPNDANTQMAVAVTAMLTLIAYRFAVDADVPRLPYLTRLDAFILMSSVLVFLSLIQVMVTTKFANRDRLDLARAIDRRCRWIFPLVFAIATVVTLGR
jgi:Neurotransmitter-gated ion-channel ligand binding domain/Neurotransmitter-gated ion-channel transmembrane region